MARQSGYRKNGYRRYTAIELTDAFGRTGGRCHLCRLDLVLEMYGRYGDGSWEIDHSVPRAKGGTHRASNLLPACVSCNRSKGDRPTRAVRAEFGNPKKPLSFDEQRNIRTRNALGTAAGGFLTGAAVAGVPGAIFGGLAGALFGSAIDPEPEASDRPTRRRSHRRRRR